jgi:hypothetical protein
LAYFNIPEGIIQGREEIHIQVFKGKGGKGFLVMCARQAAGTGREKGGIMNHPEELCEAGTTCIQK